MQFSDRAIIFICRTFFAQAFASRLFCFWTALTNIYGKAAELVKRVDEIATVHFTDKNGEEKTLVRPFFVEEDVGKEAFDAVKELGVLAEKYKEENRLELPPELVAADVSVSAPAAEQGRSLDLISGFKTSSAIYVPRSNPTQNTAIAVQSSIAPTHPMEVYNYRRSAPTAMELAKYYLSRRTIRVADSSIYVWNGSYYRTVSNADLKSDLIRVMRERLEIKGNAGQLNEIIEYIRAEPTIALNATNAAPSPTLLNVGNGVLCMNNPNQFELFAPTPSNFFTSAVRIPWNGAMPTPIFDRFLYDVTCGDLVLTERIWEAIGYLLSEDNSAKRFVLLIGPSNSGKSVFGNVISAFFEDGFISAVSASGLGAQFSLGALKCARINMSMDLTDAVLSPQAVSIIKSITGRDKVPVEEKYAPVSSCRINCKLLFSSNHVLKLMDFDKALMNRMLLIPFAHPIPKERQNPNLEALISNELSGVLHKAMQAYCRLVGNNYIFAGDSLYTADMMSEAVLDLDSTISAEEAVCNFLRERCVRSDNDHFIPVGQLYHEYTMFASANKTAIFANAQTFARALGTSLASQGFPSNSQKKFLNGKTVNVYRGIQLKEG